MVELKGDIQQRNTCFLEVYTSEVEASRFLDGFGIFILAWKVGHRNVTNIGEANDHREIDIIPQHTA